VVQYVSDRVLVMYLGKVIEIGPTDLLFREPQHPYTQALLASRLSMDPERRIGEPPLVGEPPNPINPPSGCRFRTRCAFAETVCERVEPPLFAPGRHEAQAACHMVIPGSGHSRAARESHGIAGHRSVSSGADAGADENRSDDRTRARD
jgi:peptide/nickel transport system ATP-binding protein